MATAGGMWDLLTSCYISFRNTISVKQFESKSGLIFFGPDLGPNCLQRLSADDTSTIKQSFVVYIQILFWVILFFWNAIALENDVLNIDMSSRFTTSIYAASLAIILSWVCLNNKDA